MNSRTSLLFHAAAAVVVVLAAPAMGDPLPGEFLKFQQLPLNNGIPVYAGAPAGAPYPGHDELSTAWPIIQEGVVLGYQGTFMADDFADRLRTPVVHLRWWGSYLNNELEGSVQRFLISFESDLPQGPNQEFSRPDKPLLSQIVSRGVLFSGSGTFTEKPLNQLVPEHIYEYNAELNLGKEFRQVPDTVYWLKIVALAATPEDPMRWGWHDRDYMITDPLASVPPLVNPGEYAVPGPLPFPVWHFQDDAVSGQINVMFNATMPDGMEVVQAGWAPQNYVDLLDGPTDIRFYSKDLAFEVYTVPEPGGLILLGGAALLLMRRRR